MYDAETDGFHLLFDNDVDNGDMATDAAINLIAAYRVVSYSIIVVFDLPAPSDVTAEANGIVKLMISTMDNVAAASTEAAFDKRVDVVSTDANEAVFDEYIDVAFIALLFDIMLLTSYVSFSFCPSPLQTKVEF